MEKRGQANYCLSTTWTDRLWGSGSGGPMRAEPCHRVRMPQKPRFSPLRNYLKWLFPRIFWSLMRSKTVTTPAVSTVGLSPATFRREKRTLFLFIIRQALIRIGHTGSITMDKNQKR